MRIKLLIIIISISFIISCGSESSSSSDNNGSSELLLNASDTNFTSPSSFTISSNNDGFTCDSASLHTSDGSYDLPITSGYRLLNTKKTICGLSDLPQNILPGTALEITYHKIEDDPKSVTINYSNIDAKINSLPKNSIYDFYNKNHTIYLDHDLHNFQHSEFDYSGAATSLQYIFKDKLALEFSEYQIMSDLLQYGETDNIVARRGFSLLDMKRMLEHYGYTGSGYMMPFEEALEEDLVELQSQTPFISPISIDGSLSFVAIIKINNQNITFLHPHLGYMQLPFSEIKNGNARNNEDWVVFIPEFIQE
jgi:predicted double-glycine peptidase